MQTSLNGVKRFFPTALSFLLYGACITLCLWSLVLSAPVQAQTNGLKPPDLIIYQKPTIHLRLRPLLSSGGKAEIEHLINQLATIDRPDVGYAAQSGGSGFAPLPDLQTSGAFILGSHVSPSPIVRRLVEIGPDTIPLLLAHLDDPTPTKLVYSAGDFSSLEYADELSVNPAISREKPYLQHEDHTLFQRFPGTKEPTAAEQKSYTLKVGDICFSILGQITGRGYSASRYQMTAITVINSPVRDPELCQAVRRIWTGENPRQRLFDTLLMDYSTRSRAFVTSLAGTRAHPYSEIQYWSAWYEASALQIAATTRLLYYFPDEMVPLIVRQLDNLNVHMIKSGNDLDRERNMRQDNSNSVDLAQFVKAVSWSKEPRIQVAVLRIFERTDSTDVLLATLPGLAKSHWSMVRQRFVTILRQHYQDRVGWYENDYSLLETLYHYEGDKAKPIYAECLHNGSPSQVILACQTMKYMNSNWDKELIFPLLSDHRPDRNHRHFIYPGHGPEAPTRVCDAAAETICEHRRDLAFTIVGTTKELDRQIAALRKKLK